MFKSKSNKEDAASEEKTPNPSLVEKMIKANLDQINVIRKLMLDSDWAANQKACCEALGIAEFERHCADHPELEVTFEDITALYDNPADLSVIKSPKARMIARSMIKTAVQSRFFAVFDQLTKVATAQAGEGGGFGSNIKMAIKTAAMGKAMGQ